MRDDHRAATEVEDRVFQRAERVHVEVVGRLVEQQDVAALHQRLRQVQAVALAAREVADLLLLVGALEVEARHVRPAVDLAVADLEMIDATRDLLVDRLVTVEPITTSPLSGVSLPPISLNSVDLPAPLGPMMPTMAPGGTLKLKSSISRRSP